MRAAPDNTGEQQGRWIPGQSGNPSGRPKGSRNKLSEEFLRAFAEDFEQHGAAVIEKVRRDRPQDYLKVAASLVPKQMEIETGHIRPVTELTDEDLRAIIFNERHDVIDSCRMRGF